MRFIDTRFRFTSTSFRVFFFSFPLPSTRPYRKKRDGSRSPVSGASDLSRNQSEAISEGVSTHSSATGGKEDVANPVDGQIAGERDAADVLEVEDDGGILGTARVVPLLTPATHRPFLKSPIAMRSNLFHLDLSLASKASRAPF